MHDDPEFRVLAGFLPPAALAEARRVLDRARFEDGGATATEAARAVKANEQVDPADQGSTQALQRILLQAVNASPALHAHALPRDLHAPRFARYRPGMAYGWHVDSPLMGQPPVRTDFAMTVFLDDPADYQGGELEVRTPAGLRSYKLPAGDAVLYPCRHLHRVAPVTAGVRRVMATWIQSLLPDPAQREILQGLQGVLAALEPGAGPALELQQQLANLTRMWVR